MWKANSPGLGEKDSTAYLLQYSCPFEASMKQLPWPSSFTGRISTNLIDQGQLLLQEERKRGGGGWERGGGSACLPKNPSLGPSQIPPALQRGPSTSLGHTSCPVTWFIFQNVTSSCWQLVPAMNTMTKKGGSCEVSAGPGAAASLSTWVGSEQMEGTQPRTTAQGAGYPRAGVLRSSRWRPPSSARQSSDSGLPTKKQQLPLSSHCFQRVLESGESPGA